MPRRAKLERRNQFGPPRLTIEQILGWIDDWQAHAGKWPGVQSGLIPRCGGLKWSTVDEALRHGRRGLPGGSSLRLLLARERGVRHPRHLPRLKIREILQWADAYHAQLGRWPTRRSGPIAEAPSETWLGIDVALHFGRRGLARYLSLATLLELRRGKRKQSTRAPLTERKIIRWADAFHARTDRWPNRKSGPIPEAPGETWLAVENALRQGLRGLPGGSSLVQLLVERRGIRNANRPPRLTIRQILAWADAFHERAGRWPTKASGAVEGVAEESWEAVNSALRHGIRGLRVRSTLASLLAAKRGKRHSNNLPPLHVDEILHWADAFHRLAGRWPKRHDGKIRRTRGESWDTVDLALRTGTRGLAGKSSLALLLSKERGIRSHMHLQPLTIPRILKWARAHQKRHGKRPTRHSGPISEALVKAGTPFILPCIKEGAACPAGRHSRGF